MKKLLFSVLLVGSLFGSDMEELINHAFSHNPRFKQIELEIEALKKGAQSAKHWDNPVLSIGVNGILEGNIEQRDIEAMQAQFVSITQKIDINGKRDVEAQIQALKAEARYYALMDSKAQSVLEIKKALIEYARIKNELELIQKYKSNLSSLNELTNSYIEASKARLNQSLKIELGFFKLETKEATLKEEMEIRRKKLHEILYSDSKEPSMTLNQKPLAGLQILKDRLKESYVVKKVLVEKEAASKALLLSQKNKITDPSLNVGYFNRENRADYYNVALSVPLPIFGRESENEQKSALEESAKANEVSHTQNALNFTLEKSYRNAQKAINRLKIIDEKLLPKNRQLIELTNEQIASNSATPTELFYLLNDELELEISRLDEKTNYEIALAEIAATLGEMK